MKAGLWPMCSRGVKNRRSGRALALLSSIFIGRKPDFRSVTLDLQQTPTARWRRQTDSELLLVRSFSPLLQRVHAVFYFLSPSNLCFLSLFLWPYFTPTALMLLIKNTKGFFHTAKILVLSQTLIFLKLCLSRYLWWDSFSFFTLLYFYCIHYIILTLISTKFFLCSMIFYAFVN